MYIVVCLQIVYVFRNPLKQGTPDQVGRGEGDVPNFYEVKHWIDYFKVSLVAQSKSQYHIVGAKCLRREEMMRIEATYAANSCDDLEGELHVYYT